MKLTFWQYGKVGNLRARRHRLRRNVQFILWKAGEHGNKEDYWSNFDPSHWGKFIPDNEYPE